MPNNKALSTEESESLIGSQDAAIGDGGIDRCNKGSERVSNNST